MHFVIMGSGRVGAAVASILDSQGHSVAIIDREAEAFRKLPEDFKGQKIKGTGFDRDTLIKANIEDAYAFAAISNGDNSNILAARIARETFGVEHVVARIFDPKRADAYQKLGIPTSSPVRWTAAEILRQIMPNDSETVYFDTNFGVDLIRVAPASSWLGVSIQAIQKSLNIKVAYVGREGKAFFNLAELVVQEHDELFCTVAHERAEEIRRAFLQAPQLD